MRMRTAAALLCSGLLVLGACGGDDDDDAATPATESSDETEAADDTEATDETQPADAGEEGATQLPDSELFNPCLLLTNEEIAAITGSDPGAGEEAAPFPEQRKVCTYENGLILAIEVGENYEASVQAIRDNAAGSTITDVPGVGTAAIWQDFGGVGQFVALGENGLFVAATIPAGGQEVGQALAEAMLAKL